jgi:hypothetical protein
VVVVASNFDCVSQIIQVNHVCICVVTIAGAGAPVIGPQALASWNTAPRYVSIVILDGFRIDTETLNFIPVSPGSSWSSGATMTPMTPTMTTVMVPPWCHIK